MSSSPSSGKSASPAAHDGLWSTGGAFMLWGLLPVYWKLLDTVPAFQILSHRTIWSLVFLFILLLLFKRLGEVK